MDSPGSDDDRMARAEALLRAPPTLSELIAFTRAFDPTPDLRARWGDEFGARQTSLLKQSRDTLAGGGAFAGSQDEALMCMAFCVTSAPYLDTPPAKVEAYLLGMLRVFVATGQHPA